MYDYNLIERLKPDEILVYLRKSRTDDPLLTVEEVLSKHETILDEWSERNLGARVSEGNKFREVVSGETIADRPEVQKILRMIESPKYKAILIVEVQRLSRGDLEDAGRLIKLLRYTNTIIITPQKIYNLQDEYDRDIFERELKRGNEFLEYQKKIMGRGRLLSVSQGNFIGSHPPYGYNKVWITEGKRKFPILAIHPEEAEVVRMIFDMYVNKDMGMYNIAHALDDLHIKPPREEHWSAASIKCILENVHYIGKIKWNFRKTVTVVEDGNIIKTTPRSKTGEYLVYDGKHEAIIDTALFNAAQEKQGKNHRVKGTTKVRNPLASLVYCQCGKAMTLRTYSSHSSKPRLLCINQTHCKTGSCTYEEMLNLVTDLLRRCIADFEIRIANQQGDSMKLHEQLLKSLEKKMQDLEAKELAQWEAQANPDPSQRMPVEIFKKLNEKLLKEKEEVKEALCNARKSMPDPVSYEKKLFKFQEALDALLDDTVSAERKNKLLKACIDRITYTREAPQRMKREPGEKHGERFKTSGGRWTEPPIEIDVKLKV